MASCSSHIVQIGFGFTELEDAPEFKLVDEHKKSTRLPHFSFLVLTL